VNAERITVKEADAGVRLDVFLSHHLEGVSRSQIQRYISDGSVQVNGKPVAKRQIVVGGDVVCIERPLISAREIQPIAQDIPLGILYEDEYLLAVNKPAGLVVHPGNGVADGTLVNALLFRGGALSEGTSEERPGIVHRLDKDTSGVVLVAKNNRVHAGLASCFAERKISKQYIGFCIGRPSQLQGQIDFALDRSRREPLKRAACVSGKPSLTLYELIAYRSGISIVRFSPKTGRTHQIRVHCSTAGFPILADPLYGGGKDRILRIDPAERPFAYSVYKCFTRHALHAQSIVFPHPHTNIPTHINAPLPDDFKNALRLFGGLRLLEELQGL